MCTYETKARHASKLIQPPGIVKFLIIDGMHHFTSAAELEGDGDVDLQLDQPEVGYSASEIWTAEKATYDVFMGSTAASMSSVELLSRTLRNKKKPDDGDITVSVLHVTYATGYYLQELLLREYPSVQSAGGTVVELTGDSPSTKGEWKRTIWLCLMIFMIMSCSLCFLSVISSFFEITQPVEHHVNRPRRQQRLTPWQVREKFPVGVFDGNQINFGLPVSRHCNNDSENPMDDSNANEANTSLLLSAEGDRPALGPSPVVVTDETCAICLDDYELGDKLRSLPCQHTFHSKCIVKWLTERSATCPLCKIDLYESDDEEEETPSRPNTLFSSWGSVPPEALQAAPSQPQPVRPTETTEERWYRRGRALGDWGRSLLFQRRHSRQPPTQTNATTSLTEPLLPDENRQDAAEGTATQRTNEGAPSVTGQSSEAMVADSSSSPQEDRPPSGQGEVETV